MPPQAVIVTYSPHHLTNQPVLATLFVNEPITAPLTKEDGSILWTGSGTMWTASFSDNFTGTVVFTDLVGHEAETGLEITRIDRTLAVPTITYSPKTATKGTVVASVSFDEAGVVVTSGWATPSAQNPSGTACHLPLSGEYNSTFVICEENGSWTWEFRDSAGNT
jgi:hypothetical protein